VAGLYPMALLKALLNAGTALRWITFAVLVGSPPLARVAMITGMVKSKGHPGGTGNYTNVPATGAINLPFAATA